MNTILYSVISIVLMVLVSLLGAFVFLIRKDKLKKIIMFMISFSVGVMLATAFLRLIPEGLEYNSSILIYIIIGFLFFFAIEKIIICRLSSKSKNVHSFVYINLFADVIQNFIVGIVISTSYMTSIPLGISTTIVLLLNEFPQEIGDFAILIYGGFSRKKAFLLNFLTTIGTVFGGLVGIMIGSSHTHLIYFLVSFVAGNFIYIASVDLIPELNKEKTIKKSLLQLLFMILGVVLIASLDFLK